MEIDRHYVFTFNAGDRPQFLRQGLGRQILIFSDDEALSLRLHTCDLDYWIGELSRLRTGAVENIPPQLARMIPGHL